MSSSSLPLVSILCDGRLVFKVCELHLLLIQLIPRGSSSIQRVTSSSTMAYDKELRTGMAIESWKWDSPEGRNLALSCRYHFCFCTVLCGCGKLGRCCFHDMRHSGQLNVEGPRLRACERLCFQKSSVCRQHLAILIVYEVGLGRASIKSHRWLMAIMSGPETLGGMKEPLEWKSLWVIKGGDWA